MFSSIFKTLFGTAILSGFIVSGIGWIGESGLIDQYLPSENGQQEKVIQYWSQIKDLSEGGDSLINLDSDLKYPQ